MLPFRKLQALHDLHMAAKYLLDNSSLALTPVEAQMQTTLSEISVGQNPNWAVQLTKDQWASLAVASCSPEDGEQPFLFASIMVLLDRFENPDRGGDFLWEWEAFSSNFRAAPDAIGRLL